MFLKKEANNKTISHACRDTSCQFNKLTSVFYASGLLFRQNIVNVAVDPRGDSRVDLQTTLTML